MPRPCKCRTIIELPVSTIFKPRGVPTAELKEVRLGLDEFEAVRLADLDGLYQGEAAEKMGVSRQTFGNIVESGRKKIADALVNAKALIIEGGPVVVADREFRCRACANTWSLPCGTCPDRCPRCGAADFHRAGCQADKS